jgi:hypothetical protein
MSLPWNWVLQLLTHFTAGLRLRLTLSHTLTQYFHPAPWTWETWFHPKRVITSGLWEVISLPFCLLGQAWTSNQVLTSLMRGAPLPSLVPCFTGFHCASEALTPTPQEEESPSGSTCLLVPGGIFSWRPGGGHILVTREVIIHHLHNPRQWTPKKCCRKLLAKIWNTEAISRKQHFIVPAQAQQTHVQRLSPENKGVSPYTPLQAGYRSKRQGLIHIWLYSLL